MNTYKLMTAKFFIIQYLFYLDFYFSYAMIFLLISKFIVGMKEVINTDTSRFSCLLSCDSHHDYGSLKKHSKNNFYTIMYIKLILVEVAKLTY